LLTIITSGVEPNSAIGAKSVSGLGDELGAGIAAGAGPRLDDHRGAPHLGQLLRQHAGHHVDRAARRVGADDAHHALGVAFRPGGGVAAEQGRQGQQQGADEAGLHRSFSPARVRLTLGRFAAGRHRPAAAAPARRDAAD
jgi:hypothetical protein